MATAEAAVVDTLGLVVELDSNGVNFDSLDEGFVLRWASGGDGVVLELIKAGQKVQRVLVDVQSQRKYGSLPIPSHQISLHHHQLQGKLNQKKITLITSSLAASVSTGFTFKISMCAILLPISRFPTLRI